MQKVLGESSCPILSEEVNDSVFYLLLIGVMKKKKKNEIKERRAFSWSFYRVFLHKVVFVNIWGIHYEFLSQSQYNF